MTNEKAGALIGRLKYHYDGEMREALEVVEKANRLQIPREPCAESMHYWCDRCDKNLNADIDGSNFSYCPYCGQAIDWSEE